MNFQFHNMAAVRKQALLIFFGSLLLTAGAVRAQDTAVPSKPPALPEPKMDLSVAVSPEQWGDVPTPGGSLKYIYPAAPLSSEPTDFSYNDTPIVLILKTFSSRFNKNIIPSAAVNGKVTLSLKGVPFDEAFQIMLDKMGLVAVQLSSNVIEVLPKKELPLSRESIPMVHRLAADVKVTLDSMLTPREAAQLTMAVDGASNSLIIAGDSAQISKIKELATHLDVKTPQIRIKTRIVEMEAGGLTSVGITWGGVYKNGNTTARAANNIGQLNTVAISGITPTPALQTDTFASGGFFDLSQVMDKVTLYAVLHLLAEDDHTKTLSEPSIMTANNKTALIHVGKNLPVVTTSVSQTSTVQNVSYIKEGVDLEVTPVVSQGSDQVSLKVKISVSELAGFEATNPITNERSAFTEVTIGSEKTVAIGGLMRENSTDTTTGIPVLRAIPILGALFRSKDTSHSKTDLLIMLTPEIVND